MRKVIILSAVLILLFSITTGYVLSMVQNMSVIINTKDLPEYGLIIVKSSEPEFDLLSATLKEKHYIDSFMKIKPFSVFIKNSTSKTVVGHSIVWECVNSKGEKRPHVTRYFESSALTDGVLGPQTNEFSNQTIYPGSYKMLSIVTFAGGSGSGGSSKTDSIKSTEGNNSTLLDEILVNCQEVTVSIDGVFFEDGSFVGADNSDFYNKVATYVKAKRDLDSFITENLRNNLPEDMIWQKVNEKAQINGEMSFENSNTNELYNYFTKIFAQQILRMKEVQGKEKLLARLQIINKTSLPKLRKLANP
jgi:hypothetical protein